MDSKLERNVGGNASCAAGLAAVLFAVCAHAGDTQKAVLCAYQTGLGKYLLAGDYATVIEDLRNHGDRFRADPVAESTNLCVAFIMARSSDSAHAACDEALAVAKSDSPGVTVVARTTRNEEVALAYSNRAVLNWISDRMDSARDDIAKARALAPQSDFVLRNVVVLGEARSVRALTVAAADE